MKKLLLLVLAVVLTACATAQAAQPKSDLEIAQDKWQNADISHYRFNLFISCFCVFTEDMPLIIEVKDGQVVSMEFQSGKEIDSSLLELFQRYNTLEKLFSGLENSFLVEGTDQGPADKVTVIYDETYGFPKEITIDFIEKAIDDELYLTVSEFEVLP